MQACSLLSTVAEMLPWVHYLPHSEAEKQFRSQHILLSMFAFFFLFAISLFTQLCNPDCQYMILQESSVQSVLFPSCLLMPEENSNTAWITLMILGHIGQESSHRLLWHKYLRGSFSRAQAEGWMTSLLSLIRRIKSSHKGLQLDSLF